jgi:membrane protease YdiL (CAAX protease family)
MQNTKAFLQRHAVTTYFFLVLLISWGSFLILVGPKLLRGEIESAGDAFTLFPIIVIGVCLVGTALTGFFAGREGLRDLFSRMGRWRVGIRWYAVALLTIPVLILIVLFAMSRLISPVFTPKIFPLGLLFGLVPGFLEEFGWMGFAYPRMQMQRSPLVAALLLGVLWGLWHGPVVDYLGAAAPHGVYWAPFFLAFVAIVTAVRVLIVWIYSNTGSILLAQLMHVSLTATLVILDPVHVSPAQETLWYAILAAALWIVVAVVARAYGKDLVRQPRSSPGAITPASCRGS